VKRTITQLPQESSRFRHERPQAAGGTRTQRSGGRCCHSLNGRLAGVSSGPCWIRTSDLGIKSPGRRVVSRGARLKIPASQHNHRCSQLSARAPFGDNPVRARVRAAVRSKATYAPLSITHANPIASASSTADAGLHEARRFSRPRRIAHLQVFHSWCASPRASERRLARRVSLEL
jgi:hypothetical protein